MRKMYIAAGVIVSGFMLAAVGSVFAQDGGQNGVRLVQIQEVTQTTEERREAAAQRAEERAAQIGEQNEVRRAQIMESVCERRAEHFSQLIPRLATGAASLQTAMDTVYERVQGFYESGQLSVANYDELKANVDAVQLEADAAVQAAATYEFELDCATPGAGQQLAGFRVAMSEAREALKDYRTELVALISALRAEAAEDAAGEEENDQNVDEEEEL
jgi:hypothetical protein